MTKTPALTAGTDLERLPDIVRILAMSEDARQKVSAPDGYVQREKLLFTAYTCCFAPPIEEIEMLSERHDLDVVAAAYDPDPAALTPLTFSIGVRLWWRVLWHQQFRLWRPDNGGLACFVPLDPAVKLHFRIQDGRLDALEGQPFRDEDDAMLGYRQADAAVRRLLNRWR